MIRIHQSGVLNTSSPEKVRERQNVAGNRKTLNGTGFDELLQKQLQEAAGIKFSAHAMNRIEGRHIGIDPAEAKRVGDAVRLAREKGSRESLFIGQKYALIVNVENETVITAMDKEQMNRAMITNIDSTVLL